MAATADRDRFNMSVFQIVAVGIAIVAAVWDLRSRRIPNVLTFGAALSGLVAHAFLAGWTGVGTSLAGCAVGIAFFFPIFALGGMGAGDVKLLGALGAWLGPASVVWVALFSGIAGGALAIVVALATGYTKQAFRNIWGLLLFWRVLGVRPAPELTLSTHRGPRLAYAVPVLAGLMVALWWR